MFNVEGNLRTQCTYVRIHAITVKPMTKVNLNVKFCRHGNIAALCIPLLLLLLLIQIPKVTSYRLVSSTDTTGSVLKHYCRTICYAAIEDQGPSVATSKWTKTIDETAEKLESVKVAAASFLLGEESWQFYRV